MTGQPLILYVPGLLPKPEPQAHRDALFRCLIAGIRRHDESVALDIAANLHRFDVVSWTYGFYGAYRDIALDTESIEAVIKQPEATLQDIAEASSWRRRLARWIFTIGDVMPFFIPHIANERMELHLRDLRRYVHNKNELAENARQMLKTALRTPMAENRPILLIGHSMGSVIAWDSLWQMSQNDGAKPNIDLFLTMGSPLGQRYIQRRLLGAREQGDDRFPRGIRAWSNLASVGDLTAVDPELAADFGVMTERGLVAPIEDYSLHNYFRLDGVLNVHAEYGYLANRVTAEIVADWWKKTR